jgi:hypothetical protein
MGWYLTPERRDAEPIHAETVNATCRICDKKIGYGTKFYFLPNGYSHALCEWKAEEEREKHHK